MKKVLLTICLVLTLLVSGCSESKEEQVTAYKKENTEAMQQHREKMMEQGGTLAEMKERQKKELAEIESENQVIKTQPEPVFDLMKTKGTPRQKLALMKQAAKKGRQWIIQIRKPAEHALEDLRGKGFLSNAYIPVMGIDKKHIRTGAGMKYSDDDTGPLFEVDTIYVLKEKDGWIRFRVTEANLGWSAWIQKDLTILTY